MTEANREFPDEVGITMAERIFPRKRDAKRGSLDTAYAYSYTLGGPLLAAFSRGILEAKLLELSRRALCFSGGHCMEISPDVARTSAQILEILSFGVEVAGIAATAIAAHELYILGKRALLQGIGAVAPPRIRGS